MTCSRAYAELHCHSAFSLLDGASTPERLVERACRLGLRALALTDHDDLGGAVRFARAARTTGLEAIIGAELTLRSAIDDPILGRATDGSPLHPDPAPSHLTLLARTAEGYANLSELITRARMRSPRGRGRPTLSWDELAERADGLFCLTGCPQGELARRVRAGDGQGARALLDLLREMFGGAVAVEVWDHALPEERALADRLLELADRRRVAAVATNDVHYASPSGRIVHDVLTCLRHEVKLDEAGIRLRPNGEWYLKPPSVVWRRWRARPDVVENTLRIAEECAFRLSHLAPEMPDYPTPTGLTAQEHLEALVWQGAVERYSGPGLRDDDPIRVEPPEGAEPAEDEAAGAGSAEEAAGSVSTDASKKMSGAPRGSSSVTRARGEEAPSTREVHRARWSEPTPSAPPHLEGSDGLSRRTRNQIRHELDVIERLDLAGYFLTVWEIVRFARRRGILVQGRGSAANSCVCYCLGITAVDPIRFDLLFERFLSEERGGAPDIDLDIEHERREEVLQYVYDRYGRDRAAMVCETITYRGRSAVRDAARVLGFSTDVADRLAEEADRGEAADAAGALEGGGLEACGLDPRATRVRALVEVVRGLDRLPRHRSIHVGGFVLTAGPLSRVVPIEPASMEARTVIQWDKDDLEFAGLIKIDLLGLGMLTCLAKAIRYIRESRGVVIDLARLPADDPEVYAMIQEADTVGLFQIESRAQMNSLPRLRPENFYDLVVQVALIRPGPIQGEMVHPYVRRRRGEEPVSYLHPKLEPILGRTLGVPLFQEQGMKVAVAMAGFTPGQADALRRAMGFKRSKEAMAMIEPALRQGMTERGVSEEVQDRIVKQLTAFANYGFPESHAASFALLVYASAYLKRHYAPEYCCALLNSQPMGFYGPGTLVHDARRHGVEVRPPDLARSSWDCTLEPAGPGPGGRAAGERPRSTVRPALNSSRSVDRPPNRADVECRAPELRSTSPPPPSEPEGRQAERESPTVRDDGCGPTGECAAGGGQANDRAPGAGPPARYAHCERWNEKTAPAPPPALRIGLRYVKGLGTKAREKLEAAWCSGGPFRSVEDVVRRSGLGLPALRTLAEAGAFETLWSGRGRRSALWEVLAKLSSEPLAPVEPQPRPRLPVMNRFQLVAADYTTTGLCTHGHPMEYLRPMLQQRGILSAEELRNARSDQRVRVAGVVICRQRPATAKGVLFITLEDETGFSNFVVYSDTFARHRRTIVRSSVLLIEGIVQAEQGVVTVRARHFRPIVPAAGADGIGSRDFH